MNPGSIEVSTSTPMRYWGGLQRVTLRVVLLALAGSSVLSGILVSADKPQAFVLWPGYVVELPAGHCVTRQNGPDFHVLYVKDRQSPKHAILAGIYCGFAPGFHPDCVKPASRAWKANGLSFQSVRSADGCAEFLVQDPANTQRGSLHVWFGPGAKEHAALAEALVASIRPAPLPLKDPTEPPACD